MPDSPTFAEQQEAALRARLAFGILNKAYWLIDPDTVLAQVDAYLAAHYPVAATRSTYHKGLLKLAADLRLHYYT